MIAIIGSKLDESACELAAEWSAAGALLISARDLCTQGWVFHVPKCAEDSFVAGGKTYSTARLRAVLVRRPAVVAEELLWIVEEDRVYVASEINAFLIAWLSALPCSVLNRPSATSLCGPGWSQMCWEVAAARAGIAWAQADDAIDSLEVVFCGHAQHGAASDRQLSIGRQLMVASGTHLLAVKFSGESVAAVTSQPRLSTRPLRNLVLAHLEGASAA